MRTFNNYISIVHYCELHGIDKRRIVKGENGVYLINLEA